MMNIDIRLSLEFFDHPKIGKLEKRLGLEGVLCLLKLWAWAAKNRPSGKLEGLDIEDVEFVARWKGDEGEFVAALLAMRLLDEVSGGFAIHDWEDHQAYASKSDERSSKARKAAEARWSKARVAHRDGASNAHTMLADATSMQAHAVSNAPETRNQEPETRNINTHPLPPSPGEVCVVPGEDIPPAPVGQPENLPRERYPDGPAKTDAPSKGNPQWPAFLSCWQVYPVQQGQEAAWREWMRLHRNGTLAPAFVIREAILRLVAEDSRWLRGKVPKMARWLNGKGWDDKPFVEPGGAPALTGFAGRGTQDTRAPTEFQKRQQESRGMASYLLAARKREPHDNDDNEPHWHNAGDAHGTQLDSTTTGRTFAALRAAEIA